MWEFLGSSDNPDQGYEWLNDYQKVKDRLVVELVSTDSVYDLPGRPVYSEVKDMSLSFIYKAVIEDTEAGTRAALFMDWMLEKYGITQEQLHEDAMESSMKLRPVQIMSMGNALAKAAGMPDISDVVDMGMNGDVCVVTNEKCVNGAAALFYPGIIESVSRMQGGDYYVLPSSIHETLILKDNGVFNAAELEDMVKEINITTVEPKERLSDLVYHYDSKRRVLERADQFEKRNKEENLLEQKMKELGSHYNRPRKHR